MEKLAKSSLAYCKVYYGRKKFYNWPQMMGYSCIGKTLILGQMSVGQESFDQKTWLPTSFKQVDDFENFSADCFNSPADCCPTGQEGFAGRREESGTGVRS
jgi:hypothetical protein